MAKLNAGGVVTLTVAGRRSGRPQRIPVIPVALGDTQYLVSPYGDSQWVRNLRASRVAELSRRGRATVVARAVEVPVADRHRSSRPTARRQAAPSTASSRGCRTLAIIPSSSSPRLSHPRGGSGDEGSRRPGIA